MTSIFLFIALVLLLLGVVGSAIPSVPGPLLSIFGVLIYWRSTGYSSPGPLLFTVIISTGIIALVIDYVATYFGAEKSGASKETAYAAAFAAALLFFITGPLGIIIGILGVVFLREVLKGRDSEEAIRSAFLTTLALLSSILAKVVLTILMLVLFLLSLLL